MPYKPSVLNGINETSIVFYESVFTQWIAVELIDIDRPHSLIQVFQDESAKCVIEHLQSKNTLRFDTGSAIVEIKCQDDQVNFTVEGGYQASFDYLKLMHFLRSHFS